MVGSVALAEYLRAIVSAMDCNEFVPFPPLITRAVLDNPPTNLTPLSVGNKYSIQALLEVGMETVNGDQVYHVPTTCDITKYAAPCGLGSTLGCNTTVLMYPDVQQYLVPSHLRKCDKSHIGFLCCCSSPSSASSKGMVRFLTSGVVVRCYNLGVRNHVLRLVEMLESRNCSCFVYRNCVQKYMYVGEEIGWVPFSSASAARKICNVCEIRADTNYIPGAKPVVIGLHNWSPPVIALGPTVCQGKIRYHVYKKEIDMDGRLISVGLQPAVPLNKDPNDIDRSILYTAKGSFCSCSTRVERLLSTVRIPRTIDYSKTGYLCQRIFNVFGEDTKTVLWLLGDMLVDFGTKRLFMLYGPGGIGKSAAVNILRDCLSNVIEEIPG
eukprot:15331593-Ditylum_brightwellii.AAC.1